MYKNVHKPGDCCMPGERQLLFSRSVSSRIVDITLFCSSNNAGSNHNHDNAEMLSGLR